MADISVLNTSSDLSGKTLLTAENNYTISGAFTFSGLATFSAVWTGSAFGTYALSAGGTGPQRLQVRNSTAGTENYANIILGNDSDSFAMDIRATSTTYTAASGVPQDGAYLAGTRAGGLVLGATNAAGVVAFLAGGTTEVGRWDLTSSLQIGGTAARSGTAGTKRLDIFDGTAPVGTLANGCSLYSTSGELRVMDAAGNATLLSPHDHDTNEWVYDSVDTRTGKRLRIDMERLMRRLDREFGGGYVQESA